jgi:hypothetical protein
MAPASFQLNEGETVTLSIGTAVCKIKADPSLGEGQIDKFARLLGA